MFVKKQMDSSLYSAITNLDTKAYNELVQYDLVEQLFRDYKNLYFRAKMYLRPQPIGTSLDIERYIEITTEEFSPLAELVYDRDWNLMEAWRVDDTEKKEILCNTFTTLIRDSSR